MEQQHPFDRLARTLAQPQSRRSLLRQLGVGIAAAAAGSVAPRLGRSLADSAPCATGLTLCGSACVNLQGDPNNCGSCGNALPPGTGCANGEPVTTAAGPGSLPALTVLPSTPGLPGPAGAGDAAGPGNCGPGQVFNQATGSCQNSGSAGVAGNSVPT